MTTASDLTVLVAGAGSIGRRHLRNLRALGVGRLAACDPDPERLAEPEAELAIETAADYGRALAALRPDAVFVCSPPVFHVEQASAAIEAGAHVFVEKPLSHSLDGVDGLIALARAGGRVTQLGYNLRFHPGVLMLRRLVSRGALGRVRWARVEAGQYLPDWRPWQDYRASYTARRDLGGGILLDGSHELDYTLWLLGRPSAVLCLAGRVSDLDVDVEDCATLLLRFPDGAQADVHVDFIQRLAGRSCKLAGERGTALWDYAAGTVATFTADDGKRTVRRYAPEPNEMYLAEARHFLDCIARGEPPAVGLEEGKAVLEVVEAAKRSAEHGRLEPLP